MYEKVSRAKPEAQRHLARRLDELMSKLGGVKFEGKQLCMDFFERSLEYLVKVCSRGTA